MRVVPWLSPPSLPYFPLVFITGIFPTSPSVKFLVTQYPRWPCRSRRAKHQGIQHQAFNPLLPSNLVSLSGSQCASLPHPFQLQAVSGRPPFPRESAGAVLAICLFWGQRMDLRVALVLVVGCSRVRSVDHHVGSTCMSGGYAEDNKP